MKTKSKLIISLSLIAFLAFGAIVLLAPKSSAVASETSTILAKAFKEGVYQSYAKSCMKDSFNTQDIVTNVNTGAGFGWYANNQIADSCSALIPPIYFDDIGYGNAGHVALNHFYDAVDSGGGNPYGLPDAISKASNGSKTDPTKGGNINDAGFAFLDGMNYEKGASSGEVCFRMWYRRTSESFNSFKSETNDPEDMFGNVLCSNSKISSDGNHIIDGDVYVDGPKDSTIQYGTANQFIKFNVEKSNHKVKLDCATWEGVFANAATPAVLAFAAGIYPPTVTFFDMFGDGMCEGKSYSYTPGSTTFESLRNGIMTDLVENVNGFQTVSGWLGWTTYSWYNIQSEYQDTRSGQIVESATLNLKSGTGEELGLDALKYLSGSRDYKQAKLSEDEIIILYSNYVRDYYGITNKLAADSSTDTVDKTGYTRLKLVITEGENIGHMEDLWVQVKNGTNKVPGVYLVSGQEAAILENQAKSQHLIIDVDFNTIATYLRGISASKVVDADLINANKTTSANVVNPGDQPGGGDDGGNAEATDSCYTKAGSLGWILCPIIDELGTFVRDKYPQWVAPALQINTNLFGADGSRDTYNAWNVFRNIANVCFVIIFLIIIFSQLTGVGIDNYGIKKILPKLIIGAILINLSYVICQLAIDVANIVGYGVGGIFQGISNSIGEVQSITLEGVTVPATDGDVGWLQGGGGLALVCVAVVGAISAIAVLSQGTAIIIPVLLAVLGIAISFFTLIAILAMRQAAAVLLVVASPLAFVAYMLPNTKKIFDKWMKVFQGLLIAFPACSALLYGGDMVGRILLNCANGSSWVVFSAGVVSIAPVFFIPKLIKTSMGAVSNAVSRIASGANQRARGLVNGSEWAKNLRADSEYGKHRRSLMRRAGMKIGKDGQLTYRGGKDRKHPLTTRGKMKLDAARSELANDVIARGGAGRYTGDEGLARLNSRIYKEQEKEELADVSGAQSRIMLGHAAAVDANGQAIMAKDDSGQNKPVMIDPQNIDQLRDALVNAMRKNDKDDIKAIQNILTSKGDKGREAVRDATMAFENESVYTNGEFDAAKYNEHKDAIKTAAENIMQNHSKDYKDNNRSMWDWAAEHSGAGPDVSKPEGYDTMSAADKQQWQAQHAPTLSAKHGSMSVGSVKSDTLIGMDDHELERLYSSTMSGGNGEDIAALHDMIGQALSSQAISGAKQDRQRILKEFQDNLKLRYNEPDVKKPPTPTPPHP